MAGAWLGGTGVNWHDLGLMARGGSISLLALWSWLLWRDHRAFLAARLGIAMSAGIASYILVTSGAGARFFGLALAAGATPGLFWLFARTWFNDRARLAPRDAALVALSVVNLAVLQASMGRWPAAVMICAALFRVAGLGFGLAGLWEAWRGRAGDLIEGRRRLRLALVIAVGGYVLAVTITELAVFDGGAPRLLIAAVGSSIVIVVLALCASMFVTRQADLFGSPVAAPAAVKPAAEPDRQLAERLRALMEHDKPHRDEQLTIAGLAHLLGEQEYRLRRLINRQLGHRNFAQYLNSWRLAEVKAALADPAQRTVPILTIALDAGFGSLGPFNRAFRDAEGCTPSAYRAASIG